MRTATLTTLFILAGAAGAARMRNDADYDTNELIAKLARGRRFSAADGVLSDFECGWRKAAMAQAKVLQPSLTAARQKVLRPLSCHGARAAAAAVVLTCPQVLFDALELGAAGDDHKGHTHPPCGKGLRFATHSWAPAPTAAAPRPAKELVLEVGSTHELLAALKTGHGKGTAERPVHIAMKGGVYRLNETMVLGAAQSHTKIGPKGTADVVELTGNRLLSGLKWAAAAGKPKGVWAATVPADVKQMDSLRVNGLRATRARYPNANPEFDQFPKGYVLNKTQWMPPVFPNGKFVENITVAQAGSYPTVDTPVKDQIPSDSYGPSHFSGAYRLGVGGACAHLTPPQSYWCQPDGRVAGMTYLVRTPAGIKDIHANLPHAPYKNSEDAVLTYWRPGHWFSIMYGMAKGGISAAGDATFGVGGFQGAEGHSTGAEWFIENLEEELDAPNEVSLQLLLRLLLAAAAAAATDHNPPQFFFDKSSSTLYLFFNGTGTPPPSVEVPALAELVFLNGGQANPVEGVEISGVTLTGTRPTYLEPHGLPSAGDWGMERLAAIRAKGSKNLSVTDCLFQRLDGNALMLDGYNRHAELSSNEFFLIGNSAVVLWGYEHYGDGTGGEQPRLSTVNNNFCHEIGIYQKQSSCYFHAVSAQSTIQNNLFFNGPRAMVGRKALVPVLLLLLLLVLTTSPPGELQRRLRRRPRPGAQPDLQQLPRVLRPRRLQLLGAAAVLDRRASGPADCGTAVLPAA